MARIGDKRMNVIIGVTKDPEKAIELIGSDFQTILETTESGPFMTQEEAGRWLAFMRDRSPICREISLPCATSEEGPWYGLTIQYEEQ